MPEPRRIVLKRIAEGLHHPHPERVTRRELEKHLDSLPDDGWVDKEAVKAQLELELDGARPFT
jgi:hypothetical protein